MAYSNQKNTEMKKETKERMVKTLNIIAKDRKRTNILKSSEQKLIAYLVQRIPMWINSDGLTAIGFFGNLMVASSIVMGAFLSRYWLLLSLIGFAVNWFGDSLDGRIAYYRNRPRKWYGFSLDVTVDWVGTILIGLGFMIYAQGVWKYLGFLFVVLYGWQMITAQLRYKISGQYSIDSGIFGPTEVRIILSAIITLEVFFPGSIYYLTTLATAFLVYSNLVEAKKLLILADQRDMEEKRIKAQEIQNRQRENA